MQLPQRRSLSVETKAVIQSMIDSGQLKYKLPGERELAARLYVGRDTLRAALSSLEREGWISAASNGRRREILEKVPASGRVSRAEARTGRIGFLSPRRVEQLPPPTLLELDHVREMLAARGMVLEVHSPSIFDLQRPGSRLRAFTESQHCDTWILYQSTKPIQQWFMRQDIPCLVRGQVYPGLQLPSLDQDWRAVGFHAANSLIRLGHRSIGLLMPDVHLQGLVALRAGTEEAVAKTTAAVTFHPLVEKRSTESIVHLLKKLRQLKYPPTALMLTRPRQVLTVICWMGSQHLSVPRDLSLIALGHDNLFDAIVPKMAYYNLDVSFMARSLVRKLDAVLQGQRQGEKLVIPDYVAGLSVQAIDPK